MLDCARILAIFRIILLNKREYYTDQILGKIRMILGKIRPKSRFTPLILKLSRKTTQQTYSPENLGLRKIRVKLTEYTPLEYEGKGFSTTSSGGNEGKS